LDDFTRLFKPFDTNVWNRMVFPERYVNSPNYLSLGKIKNAIRSGQVRGFISEGFGTAEAVKKPDRAKFHAQNVPNVEVTNKSCGPGLHCMTIEIKASNRLHPGIGEEFEDETIYPVERHTGQPEDFVPAPDFLERTVPFFADAEIGMVQVRWGHLNREFSILTQAQSILLDGHFMIEHTARNRSGCFFNFNGTAGIWRRAVIQDAGGWQHDTLTEDLDLSYRAQMRGWRFVYLQDVVSPAEVPVEMNAFKSQQHRWAKGSVQTCKKLLPKVLASGLPWHIKLESAFHLTANFAYPLMILLSLLMFPAMVIRYNMGWYEMMVVDVPLFIGATLSVCSFYLMSQREVYGDDWRSRIKYLPAVLAVGIGLSVNNAKAVLEALVGHDSEFTRTPKYRVEGAGDDWKQKRYRGTVSFVPFVELTLGAYFSLMAYYAASNAILGPLPFIFLFQAGFLYAATMSLFQGFGKLDLVREQEA